MKSATIIRLDPRGRPETVALDDTETACRLLQRELFRPHLNWKRIAHAAGVQPHTIANIAYGETKSPHFNTVVRLLVALGWTLAASR